ncbi:MAG: hypothetical protein ACOC38_01370 [Promethearchaeia archaeon]
MSNRNIIGEPIKRHVRRYNLWRKIDSILSLLGEDAKNVVSWAYKEAKRQLKEKGDNEKKLGRKAYNLIAEEAAIRLVRENHDKGRMTTKSEVRKKTGYNALMPNLFRDAGVRHPQEARNLRHNLFHHAFSRLIQKILPDTNTSIPPTGGKLSPDLLVRGKNPGWSMSVEYKGYRSITLVSESELLKAMRYQAEYGSSWLVTTSTKSVKALYGSEITSKELIERGLPRLRRISRKRTYTQEQREKRGIALKGIRHLKKQKGCNLKCRLISAEELIESCQEDDPIKGVAITTGLELKEMLKNVGLNEAANDVLRVMKLPAQLLHSDKVTSMRLIG